MAKKFFLYTLVFLILSVAMWYTERNKPHFSSQDVLGSSTNLQLFIQPDAGTDPIVSALNGAQKDILVEDYLLSDKEIITALEQAKQRGVDVEVMLEEHPFGGSSLNHKAKTALTKAGISFKWTNPNFALTHEKAIVIDDNEAIIMTQNLTAAAFKSNREYDIIATNPADVSEIETMFKDAWQRSTFDSTTTNLVISPNTSRGKLEALITSATQSINLEVEDIDDKKLMSLLETKAKTMPVEIILPTLKQLAGKQVPAEQLKPSGVSVHAISHPYMNAKLILVDGTRAYIGSVNYSTQSMDENRELGIIVSQSDIIEQLNQTFQSDWSNSSDL